MKTRYSKHIRSRRTGIALVLVVMVMALAAVLSYAMLSASAVQATASSNAVAAAIARAQAESGVHLAMYYLLNPGNAPASFGPPGTVTTTFATVSPANTMPGSVTVQVGALVNHCCFIVATGSSSTSSGVAPVTRKITAEVQVGTPLPINEAGGFNTSLTSNSLSSFTSGTSGAPAIASKVAVVNNGHVNGNISAPSVSGTGTETNGHLIGAPSITPAPSAAANVSTYTTYVYQGTTYNAQAIGSTISAVTSLGPNAATNPLGVFYTTGALTVSKALTVNGTLVVNGILTNSSTINITPVVTTLATSMPALVVAQSLKVNGASRTLNATGVVYVGQGITGIGTTTTSSITVNGALLVTSGGLTGFSGTVAVTYNAAYTNIPTFDTADWDSSSGVKIISWSE